MYIEFWSLSLHAAVYSYTISVWVRTCCVYFVHAAKFCLYFKQMLSTRSVFHFGLQFHSGCYWWRALGSHIHRTNQNKTKIIADKNWDFACFYTRQEKKNQIIVSYVSDCVAVWPSICVFVFSSVISNSCSCDSSENLLLINRLNHLSITKKKKNLLWPFNR